MTEFEKEMLSLRRREVKAQEQIAFLEKIKVVKSGKHPNLCAHGYNRDDYPGCPYKKYTGMCGG